MSERGAIHAEPSAPGPRRAENGGSGERPPRLIILTGLDIRAYRGGEKFAIALGSELERRGVEVRLLSKLDPNEHYRLHSEDLPAAVRLPVDFYPVVFLPLLPALLPRPLRFLRALRWADAIYDIEATPRFLEVLVVVARVLRRPLVIGLHSPTFVTDLAADFHGGVRSRWHARWAGAILRRASALHALTTFQAETLSEVGLGSKVNVVHLFSTMAVRAPTPSGRETCEALFVGPLERDQKGIDLLADIARRVLIERPTVRLTIVGAGRDRGLVEGLGRDFPGRVRLLGFVPEADLPSVYAGSNMLWLSSRSETFPAVALEAFFQGVPVVGFDIPGFREISSIFPAGRVPTFDTTVFARKAIELHDLWRDRPEEYERIRAACRAEAAKRFSAEGQVPQLARLLGLPLRAPREPTSGR